MVTTYQRPWGEASYRDLKEKKKSLRGMSLVRKTNLDVTNSFSSRRQCMKYQITQIMASTVKEN